MDTAPLLPASIRDQFTRDVVYLNTASYGLPPRVAHEATLAVERDRAAGRLTLAFCDEAVERSRAAYARLVGLPVSRVAVGSQASQFVGLVAASLRGPGASSAADASSAAAIASRASLISCTGGDVAHAVIERVATSAAAVRLGARTQGARTAFFLCSNNTVSAPPRRLLPPSIARPSSPSRWKALIRLP